MAKFRPLAEFQTAPAQLTLLPFTFERLADGRVIISNFVGDMMFATDEELRRLVSLDVTPGESLYDRAFEKLLIAKADQSAQLQLLGMRLRSRMSFLRQATPLHIFVVTLRCEHSCPYCQVSRRSSDKELYDMSDKTAMKALDVALSANSHHVKIEFQGGEPLLNFDLIKTIVRAAQAKAPARGKEVQFVITSNLALLTDEVLDFALANDILISTSLDGPKDLHNKNRPRPGGNSHELAVDGIRRIHARLGRGRVGALMTTTLGSLNRVEEIVDEYLRLGLEGIFLRPLSPYGFAVKTKTYSKYRADDWLSFYERGLRYILEVNKRGTYFPEFYAALLLRRMLTDKPSGYVDLRSPAGIGLGALVYNYDGKVFASDEGRMLAEMGDRTFELGDLAVDGYADIILSDKLVGLVGSTLSQCAPQCNSCAFEAHCGADPVYHHATQADATGIKPLSEFCGRQKGMLSLLLDLLVNSPDDAAILRSWAR
jgi:His-Xaa-Ser system radical SAM maturase HxsB